MSSSPKLDSYNIKLDGFIEAFGPLKDEYSKFGQIFILGAFMGKVLDIAKIEIGQHALGGRHQSTQYEDNVTNILRFVFDYIKNRDTFLKGGTYTSEGKPLSAEEALAESRALDDILTVLSSEYNINKIKEWCVHVDFQFVAKGTEDSLSSAAAINRAFGDITAVITNPEDNKKIYYPINVKMIDSKTKSFNAGSCKQLNYVLFGEISSIQWGPFARRLAIANDETNDVMKYLLDKDYYYIVYFKDKLGKNTFTSLGQVSKKCITVNPSNPLQLKPPKLSRGSNMMSIKPIAWMDEGGRDMPKIKEFLLELTEEYFIKLANYLLLYVGDTDGLLTMIGKHQEYIEKAKRRVEKQSKKIWTK